MPKVKLLSKNICELIAAGEVVERPASVVKELVENSLDAGATSVEVEISGGGLSLIRVSDNGCGIDKEDVRTAFLRHATSKISAAEDLDSIVTLGFRGEALAAISSVSKVRLITKRAEDDFGTEIRLEGGEEVFFDEAGAKDGTTIVVSDLFYNTPARMKFLKKDVAEGNSVRQIVERLAMCRPDVAFRFVRDGVLAFSTPGDSDRFSAIFAVMPREVSGSMLEVSGGSERCFVEGYISSPGSGRKSRSWQHLFVNGRYVKSRSIPAAIEEAYRSFSMHGRYPSFVLSISVPADSVDVNVHPAKTEVRFADERLVTGTVYRVVKGAVEDSASNFEGIASIAFSAPSPSKNEVSQGEQIEFSAAVAEPVAAKNDAFSDFASFVPAGFERKVENFAEETVLRSPSAANIDYERKSLLDIEAEPAKEAAPVLTRANASDTLVFAAEEKANSTKNIRVIGEAFTTYIIAEYGDELIIVDKHAAHERILFEYLNKLDLTGSRQMLLSPVVVSVSAEEKSLLLEAAEDIENIGFIIDDFGDNAVAVREVPVFQKMGGIEDAVAEMAHQLSMGAVKLHTRENEWLLHSVSCRAAIKAGHKTTSAEMLSLVEQIVNGSVPKFCPHGRPVFFTMSKKELEKSFGRIV